MNRSLSGLPEPETGFRDDPLWPCGGITVADVDNATDSTTFSFRMAWNRSSCVFWGTASSKISPPNPACPASMASASRCSRTTITTATKIAVSRTFKPNRNVSTTIRAARLPDVAKKSGISEDCLHHRCIVGRLRQRWLPRPLPLYSTSTPGSDLHDHVLRTQRPAESALSQQSRRYFHERDGESRRRGDRPLPGNGFWRL